MKKVQNKSKNSMMKDYHWISHSCSGSMRAKNMKDACKKAILAQMPEKLDKYDKKKLYFSSMKVVKGKLPKFW